MKIGLVLEGGGMRGMYTTGVLDAFLDNGIEVDEIVGVSAGALFGVNYVSKQRERALRYNKKYSKDKRYMSIRSLIKTGNFINKDFAYREVPFELDIFDSQTFHKNKKKFYATVTNVETGKAEYILLRDVEKDIDVLRASGAIPVISEIVDINNKKYLDGGISDSIPVDFFRNKGFEKVIVVLTRPLEYRKKPLSKIMMKIFNRKYKEYPNFVKTMEDRYKNYNDTVEHIIDLEKNKEIFVIRPSEPITIKQLERDPDKLQMVYDLGFSDCNKILKKLKKYLKET